MSDTPLKRWLADDPHFLTDPNDLDRGPNAPHENVTRDSDAGAQRPPDRGPAARPHRPLLELFPPSMLEPETPPPRFGGAVGPPLPFAPVSEPETRSPLHAATCEAFFGLREKPFNLSTDPRFHYRSAEHERASIELLGAIRTRAGPAVLKGAPGTGKTTLCRALVRQLDRGTVWSIVRDAPQSIDDLLKTMLVDFGVVAHADVAANPHLTRDVLAERLESFLDALISLKGSAVVFVDEAQQVPVSVLGDLAALASRSTARSVLQLVLVGHPTLDTLLRHADLRVLNATVAHRIVLGRLRADEIGAYVSHRLSTAGGAPTRIAFDDDAIARLFDLSHGTPRLVNLLCDHAMTRGCAASAVVIDRTLIDGAAGDLDLGTRDGDGRGTLSAVLMAIGFALLLLAGAAAALYVSREDVNLTIQQWEHLPQPPGGPVRRLPVPIAPLPPP